VRLRLRRKPKLPKAPDSPGLTDRDLCLRCAAFGAELHRPCFRVGCFCSCSRVPGYCA